MFNRKNFFSLILLSCFPCIAFCIDSAPPPPSLSAKAYVLMDGGTGKILASSNSDTALAPASLTKMMTSYVISTALKNGKIHINDLVPISEKAWKTGGSKMFVKVGTQVSVKDLMQGIIVDSGNDACIAMAEYVAGSEDVFANLMNQASQALEMTHTHFVNSTGLPDPMHYSTSKDLATLARALIYNFPEDYQWYAQKWFTYNGIHQPNRNRLLWRDPSVDGIKTGHTEDAGFCLVSAAKHGDTRLISVIMGAPSDTTRADDSQKLLDYGFRFFETHVVYPANSTLATVRVWYGTNKEIPVGVINPFMINVIPGQFNQVYSQVNVNKELIAPLQKGEIVGEVQAIMNGKVIDKIPLVALQDDPVGNFLRRLFDKIAHWWHHR